MRLLKFAVIGVLNKIAITRRIKYKAAWRQAIRNKIKSHTVGILFALTSAIT